MSHSPETQLRQGAGSGRRTMPTTQSPRDRPLEAGASSTSPSDSCPSTIQDRSGGGLPSEPFKISRSVPQTPTASERTSRWPRGRVGSGMSCSRALPAFPGSTVTARMSWPPRVCDENLATGRASLQAVDAQLVIERAQADAEEARGQVAVPLRLEQRLLDLALLGLGHGPLQIDGAHLLGRGGRGGRGVAGGLLGQLAADVGGGDRFGLVQHHQALDQVLQLADVAGPALLAQLLEGRLGD